MVGRPNAGKSTLMNRWLREKVAIVSDKPQTTRHRLVGVLSEARGQVVFHDTPGVHRPQHRMNRRMVREATDTIEDCDVVCLIVDASVDSHRSDLGSGDHYLADLVAKSPLPKVVVLNKIDLVKKRRLLPRIGIYAERGFERIVPVSAKTGDGSAAALDVIFSLLPEGEALYDRELLTPHSERFLVAERIREKVLEQTRDELPFATAVVIESWLEEPEAGRMVIAAAILVEKPGQKAILIGQGGSRIKALGIAARKDLEQYLGKPLRLELFVRESSGWREDPRVLAELDRYRFPG